MSYDKAKACYKRCSDNSEAHLGWNVSISVVFSVVKGRVCGDRSLSISNDIWDSRASHDFVKGMIKGFKVRIRLPEISRK